MKITKKQLLSSPSRPWADTNRLYDAVLFVQDGTKHDSGYMRIVLIGTFQEGEETRYEILGYPDDISLFADPIRFGANKEYKLAQGRMDCYYPQGVFQYHGRGGKFKVSEALSSMEIDYIPKL